MVMLCNLLVALASGLNMLILCNRLEPYMSPEYVKAIAVKWGGHIDTVITLELPREAESIPDIDFVDVVFDLSSKLSLSYLNSVSLMEKADLYYRQQPHQKAEVYKLSLTDYCQLVDAFSSAYSWHERVIVTDFLEDLNDFKVTEPYLYFLEPGTSAETVRHLYAKLIRNTGIKQLFIIARPALTETILKVLHDFRVDAGFAIVSFAAECVFSYSIYSSGVLCAAFKGLESSKSIDELEVAYMLRAIERQSREELILFNLVAGVLKKVGTLTTSGLTLSAIVLFPGNLAVPPSSAPVEIAVVLANYFVSNVPGKEFNWQRSTNLAFHDFPLDNKRFKISPVSVPECSSYNKTTGYMSCLTKVASSKATMILSTSEVAETVYSLIFMRQTGLTFPFIESRLPVNILSSIASFPFFTRVMSTLDYYLPHTVLFMIKLGFTKTNLLLSRFYGSDIVEKMLAIFQASPVQILTPEEIIFLEDYTGDNYSRDACQSIYDSAIRPTLVFLNQTDLRNLMLECYDQGLRAEDVVFLAISADLSVLVINQVESTKQKLLSFENSFLGFYPATLVNSEGINYNEKFTEAFGYIYYNDCGSYDLAYATVLALDFALKRGLNIYKTDEMMTAIRNLRFKGCTGEIQLGYNDNNRKDSMISAYKSRLNEGMSMLNRVFDISISGNQQFVDNFPMTWYDGTSNIPKSDRYTYKDCPFPEEWRVNKPESQVRSAWIMLGFVLMTSGFAWAIKFRYYRFIVFKDNAKPILLSTQDMLIFIISLAEPMQFLLLAPFQDFFNAFTMNLFKRAVWNHIDFSDGTFWLLINSFIAIYVLWFVVLTYVLWMQRSNKSVDIQLLLFVLLRLGNFAFIFGLLTTFDCREGSSESGASSDPSFMDVDCYETCWRGKHMKYSIGVSLTITTYIMTSILSVNYIHFTMEGHQYVTSPTVLLLRIVVQMAAVCLYKTRHVLGHSTYTAMFLVLVGAYVGFLCMKKSLSVPSLNLWHSAAHFAVLYVCIVGLMEELWFKSTLMGGGFIISGLFVLWWGLRYKLARVALLVIKPPKPDIGKWLVFAFRRAHTNIDTKLSSSTQMF